MLCLRLTCDAPARLDLIGLIAGVASVEILTRGRDGGRGFGPAPGEEPRPAHSGSERRLGLRPGGRTQRGSAI